MFLCIATHNSCHGVNTVYFAASGQAEGYFYSKRTEGRETEVQPSIDTNSDSTQPH